jgi:hypothetical protein
MRPPTQPPRYRDTSCPLCKECVYDTLYQMCIYGGPYRGFYVGVEEEEVKDQPL